MNKIGYLANFLPKDHGPSYRKIIKINRRQNSAVKTETKENSIQDLIY